MPNRLIGATAAVLALDSSAGACSVAVVRCDITLAAAQQRMTRGHAEVLLPMVRAVMAEAGIGFGDLGAIGATVGPGSFTGLRVGLAAARGLALATGIPCIGVTVTEAIAAQVGSALPLLVVVDTRRGDIYGQVFADGAPRDAPFVAGAAGIARHCAGVRRLAGDGALLVAGWLPTDVEAVAVDLPDPAIVGRLAAARIGAARFHPARPLYLRDADVTVPAAGGGASA
ncbi:MAG: tRNA (adenosine(37)-N6)-threonylcarbamoyltransferase complex dimerization subunit type 1 TsaB [Alphaproteobacteria bacterium]